MDLFRVLSRGASLKKSKHFSNDYAMPNKTQSQKEGKKENLIQQDVEKETDFFKTNRRAKTKEIKEIEDNEVDDEEKPQEIPLSIATNEDASIFRKANQSNVTGTDIPLPIGSFDDLITSFQFNEKLLKNLINSEFVEPTPIQSECIPIMMHQKDVIACAPTGSGKTLAYVLPLIQTLLDKPVQKNHGIRGLVIAPTNELASQIHQQLDILTRNLGLKIGIISKQLAAKFNDKIVNGNKYDIVVSTPLRLIDLVKKESINLTKVETLVIDEADKLFEQGFLQQTDEILSQLTNPKVRKCMFSATIPSGVEEIAQAIMVDAIRVIIGHKEAASSSVSQQLTFTGNEEGKLLAIRQLIQEGQFKPPIIIFLQSITRAKALFHELIYDKLNVDVIHAERTPKQRDEAIRRFKNGDIWVLITTDVLSRGVDFKGVNLVINYDVPQSAQAYVHRIGRTGRGGKSGKAITFFTKEDSRAIKPIINIMKQSGSEHGYSSWMENIDKLSKNEKKSIKRKQIDRKQISTVPKVMKQKRKQKQEMIEASKRRKEQKEHEPEPEPEPEQ